MKDDAIFCEHPGGSRNAYIAYWRHRQLMHQQRKIIRLLSAAVAILTILIIWRF